MTKQPRIASDMPRQEIAALIEAKRPAGHKPLHEHDCRACIFIKNGLVEGEMRDWYICPGEVFGAQFGGSLIARFGREGEYSSFDLFTILSWDDPSREGMNFGGKNPDGFVQQGRKVLAELGYALQGGKVMLEV